MNVFDIIFNNRKKIQDLQNECEKLREQLKEKQEHINKTNSYWKKKFYAKKS